MFGLNNPEKDDLIAAGASPEVMAVVDGFKKDWLKRHSDIVQSIYRENRHTEREWRILTGYQDADGHRYFGERCVWCGVNYLDHLIYDGHDEPEGCSTPCPGPSEGEWNEKWWPLDKIDALLKEHRKEN